MGPAAQGDTDSHTSDIGHWFGMTGAWVYRQTSAPPAMPGARFLLILFVQHGQTP